MTFVHCKIYVQKIINNFLVREKHWPSEFKQR